MSFLKGAVIFTFGVGVGVSGSYIVFKKKYDEREEDLKELKDHYNRKILDEADKMIAEDIVKKEGYIPYDKIIPEKPEVDPVIIETAEKNYPEDAFIIDEVEYSEKELYFEKVELDYYVEDEALVDEGNELTDVNSTIGWDILEKFTEDESEDTIYVRNSKNNTDYLVNKCFGKYSDIVGLGGDESDD